MRIPKSRGLQLLGLSAEENWTQVPTPSPILLPEKNSNGGFFQLLSPLKQTLISKITGNVPVIDQMLQNGRAQGSLVDHLVTRLDSSPNTLLYRQGNWDPKREKLKQRTTTRTTKQNQRNKDRGGDWVLIISQKQGSPGRAQGSPFSFLLDWVILNDSIHLLCLLFSSNSLFRC